VMDDGKIIGVVAVQINNQMLQKLINDDKELGRTGETVATVLRDGKLLTMTPIGNGEIGAFAFLDPVKMGYINTDMEQRSGERYGMNRLGKEAAIAWDYQDELRWTITSSIDENELLSEWNKQTVSLSLLFFLGVIVVIMMIAAAFRSFSRPIQELTDYAIKVSKGDYTIDMDSRKYDREWELLIQVFKQMSVEINHRVDLLNRQYAQLASQKDEISELNRMLEAKIEEKSKQLQKYLKVVDQYVITSQTDVRGVITYVSEAFCVISGYTKDELIGRSHNIVRHPDMPDEFFADLWTTISSGESWHGEIKNRAADGGYYWVDTVITPTIEEGKITGYTAVRHDITHQKKVEELAITDFMTGLYNRRYYNTIIHNEMNRARRYGHTLALMMIDVDNFKLYNDTYGHQAGDEVLSHVAEILKHYTSRSGEYAFRMGGEEFGILVNSMEDDEYRMLGERIRLSIEEMSIPHTNNTASSFVTISVGIAVYHSDAVITPDELYKESDLQLYIAKEEGRNRVMLTRV